MQFLVVATRTDGTSRVLFVARNAGDALDVATLERTLYAGRHRHELIEVVVA